MAEGSKCRFVFPIWGPSGGCLGALLGRLGRLLDHLEALLDALEALVGFSWAVLGLSWGSLGPSWGCLGAVLGFLGLSWALLGLSWGCLGALLGLSWGLSWAILEPSRGLGKPSEAKRRQARSRLGGHIGDHLRRLGGLLGRLGALSGPSRGPLGPSCWWPSGWPSAGLPGALLGRRLNGASAGARGRTGTMNEHLVRRSGGLSGAPVLGHRLFFWGGGPRRTRLPLASEGRFKLLGAVFQPRDHQERAQDEKLPRPLPSRASKRRPPKF